MGRPLATAYIRVRPDLTGFKAESEAGAATAGRESGRRWELGFRPRVTGVSEAVTRALSAERNIHIGTAAAQAKLRVLRSEIANLGNAGGLPGTPGGAGGAAGAAGIPGGAMPWAIGAGAILSPPVIGAGLGLAGFGAIAIPTLMKVTKAQTALNTAQAAYAKATTAAGRKSALAAEAAATAGLTKSQIGLMGSLHGLQQEFGKMVNKLSPVIAAALKPVINLAKSFLPLLKPLAISGGAILDAFIRPLTNLVKSPFFSKFLTTMAGIGVQFAQLFGPEVISIIKSVLGLIMNLAPSVMTLWKALGPLVTLMVKEFAGALGKVLPPLVRVFAAVLKAVTPLIPPLTKLWLQIFPPLIKLFARLAIDVLPVLVAIITRFLIPAIHHLIGFIRDIMKPVNWLNDHWKQAWNDLWNWTKRIFGDLVQWVWNDFILKIINFFKNLWDTVWRNAKTAWSVIVGWFKTLPGTILNALSSLGRVLLGAGKSAMGDMWSGIKSVASSILGWFGGFISSIVGFFKKILGLGSPSRVFYDIGKNMMLGLEKGIRAHAHKAAAAAKKAAQGAAGGARYTGSFGPGVTQWTGDVHRALAMLGLSQSLTRNVLYQMMTESGGNPNAINLTDSNAAMGDPSRGLMQVIGSTFAAYAGLFAGRSIYDPMANIYAAINYALHRYGPTLMSGGMGIGSGHGYDAGGWLQPGMTLAVNQTGRPERVTSPRQEDAMTARLDAVIARLDAVIRAVYANAGDTAHGVAMALGGAAHTASVRAEWSPR